MKQVVAINPQPVDQPPVRAGMWSELKEFLSQDAQSGQWYEIPVEDEGKALSARSAAYNWRQSDGNGVSLQTSIRETDDGIMFYVRKSG